jgi:hypothetical protein
MLLNLIRLLTARRWGNCEVPTAATRVVAPWGNVGR